MLRKTIFAAVSTLALLSAVPALAQDAGPLVVGSTVDGQLSEGDPAASDEGYRYDTYVINAQAGRSYEVVMRSDAFDAMLELYRGEASGEPLDSDDDGLGEGTNSRLRFTAVEDGVYTLRARSLIGDDTGDYSLSLAERELTPEPAATPIRLGQTLEGALDEQDAQDDEGAFDAYSFEAQAGERFVLAMNADDLDSLLRVGVIRNGVFVEQAMNDDGADGLNSRLVFTAGEAGTYVIHATSYAGRGRGSYSLSLSEGPAPLRAAPIEIGARVRGELTAETARNASDRPADAYRFSGREGQRVRIDMTSRNLDSYLELFDENQQSLATDDDGGPVGVDSRLVFTLPRTGSYVIEARAYSDGTGPYTLEIKEIQPDAPPRAIAFGATVEGEIGENDSTDTGGRTFDAYRFSATAGQRVRAIMRSGDFDSLLQLAAAEGDFEPIASDDDGLGEGLDSRLDFTIKEDGDYIIRALPYGADSKGLYSLELLDRGPEPKPGSLLVGTTVRGVLTETDATTGDNSFYDAYRLTLRADDKLIITMVSNDFDSFLMVGRQEGDADFEMLASDDDSLSDTHAKVEWTVPDDGVYEIRANAFAAGQTGAYALRVEKKTGDE
jgi:hypothetical protein